MTAKLCISLLDKQWSDGEEHFVIEEDSSDSEDEEDEDSFEVHSSWPV